MGLDNAIYALSNVNAILGSAIGYNEDKRYGLNTGDALMNFGFNIMQGGLRNEVAREIRNGTGSYLGYAVNSIAGYGNPEANINGSMGLTAAALLSSPFGIFGCGCGYVPYMTSSIYGCGPYGMGYFGGNYFGGFNNFMFGGPSMFGFRGCWC